MQNSSVKDGYILKFFGSNQIKQRKDEQKAQNMNSHGVSSMASFTKFIFSGLPKTCNSCVFLERERGRLCSIQDLDAMFLGLFFGYIKPVT